MLSEAVVGMGLRGCLSGAVWVTGSLGLHTFSLPFWLVRGYPCSWLTILIYGSRPLSEAGSFFTDGDIGTPHDEAACVKFRAREWQDTVQAPSMGLQSQDT